MPVYESSEAFLRRYQFDNLLDQLGHGGFGTVYKAYDRERDREVAIKICRIKSPTDPHSLYEEVKLARSIPTYRHIAHYEDCYRLSDQTGLFDYAVLQYYPLGNLSQLLKTVSLDDEAKIKLARGILKGLQHLHHHDIIHRDLKPANILIAQNREGDFVPKITDFGLSKQLAEQSDSVYANSVTGGTVYYSAPEQLKGDDLRRNTDLWAFGIVLFELFTGHHPFLSTTDKQSSRPKQIRWIQRRPLPAALLDRIPDPYRKLIRMCLVKDPAQRAPDALALSFFLNTSGAHPRHYADGRLVRLASISQPNLREQAPVQSPPARRSSYSFTRILVGLVLLLLGGGWVYAKVFAPSPYTKTIRKIEAKMVFVEGGEFQMGCMEEDWSACREDNHPFLRDVKDFYIGKYEVTQAEWETIMGTNPSYGDDCPNCPVTNVNWNEAQAFLVKLQKETGKIYRLPFEDEWEYAAKGGIHQDDYIYSGSDKIKKIAWFEDNCDRPQKVGSKKPNALGLYDMSGNVWEWCDDWYQPYPDDGAYYRRPGRGHSKVVRGGGQGNAAKQCRTDSRGYEKGGNTYSNLGFRVAYSN